MANKKPQAPYLSRSSSEQPNWQAGDDFIASLTTEKAPEKQGILRTMGDQVLSLGQGVVGGVKMLSDLAGPDNAVSKTLGEANTSMQGMFSAGRAEEMKNRQALIQAADDGDSTLDQITTRLGGIKDAPMQTFLEAMGSMAPNIAAALATGGVSAGPGLVALAARFGVPAALGVGMGVGSVKGQNYEAVFNKAKQEGLSDDEAVSLGIKASEYSAQNAPQQALGGAFGMLDSLTGAERMITGMTRKAGAEVAAKPAQGLMRRTVLGAAEEAPAEGLQGAQGQYAQNEALNNAGFTTNPWSGVAGAGINDAVVGAMVGGPMGALHNPARQAPVITPQQAEADAIRATELVPEAGAMTRAANVGTEAKARAVESAPPVTPEDVFAQELAATQDDIRQSNTLQKMRDSASPTLGVTTDEFLAALSVAGDASARTDLRRLALDNIQGAVEHFKTGANLVPDVPQAPGTELATLNERATGMAEVNPAPEFDPNTLDGQTRFVDELGSQRAIGGPRALTYDDPAPDAPPPSRQAVPQLQAGDIQNKLGKPFTNLFAAKNVSREAGVGYVPVKLGENAFVVRKVDTEINQAPALAAPTPAATETVATAQVEQTPDVQDVQPTPPAVAPAAKPTDHIGRNNKPLSEGGKPFKTKDEASAARKLQPMLRVVKSPTGKGFALAPKTEAQLAAQDKAAKRLSLARTGKAGVPTAAHEFIAGEGGMDASTRTEFSFGANPRVGNRTLFAGARGGLSLDAATEKLIEAGYLPQGASHSDTVALINRSFTQPQYTVDGTETVAQAEVDARFDDYLAAEQDAAQHDDFDPFESAADLNFTIDDAEMAGYDAAEDPIKLEVNALLAQAGALGIETSDITEQAYEDTRNGSEQDYYDAARAALAAAIETSNRSSNQDAGAQGNAGEQEGLTAPSRAEVLAQQAQREAEDQRKQDGGDRPLPGKKVTGDTPDMFNTQASVFDVPAEPDAPAAKPITPNEAANMQRGDIVRDSGGVEYYAWSARFGRIDVVPLKDGKPVVYAGSSIRFALDQTTREANPEYRAENLYLVENAPISKTETTAKPAKLDYAADFSIRPVEIIESLIDSGSIKALYKAAGVKTANAFGDLPMEIQSNAYAKFVKEGGAPAPAATESYNDKVIRMEREIVVRRLQSDQNVNQANGKPFKTEASARQFSSEFDLDDTHKITPSGTGYTLQRLGEGQRPSVLKAIAERQANDPEEIRQNAAWAKAEAIGTAADAAVLAYGNGDTSIDEFERALDAAPVSKTETTANESRSKLMRIAERLEIPVVTVNGSPRASGGMVEIPAEDSQTEGAVTPEHVFAHELGHAIMAKRQMNFSGFPKAEMLKWISNWDQWIASSKAFRPDIHAHKDERIRRHAKKPNEIIADAIGSVLLGNSPASLVMGSIGGLTERDMGMDGEASSVKQEAREPASEATAILDAANITGKERIEALKDVKKGDITPEELEAAYPAKEREAKESAESAPIRIGDQLKPKDGFTYTVVDVDGNIVDAERVIESGGGVTRIAGISMSAVDAIEARKAAQPADAAHAQDLTYTAASKIDTPAQGELSNAKEQKERAFERLKNLRSQVNDGRSDLRLELIKAESAHKDALRRVSNAQDQIEKDANKQGLTTIKPKQAEQGAAMFSRRESSVLSKDGKFKGWPKFNAWTRQEYSDVVSLLPAAYREDAHRREPVAAKDWDALAAAVLPELEAINNAAGEGAFRLDPLGNIIGDVRRYDSSVFASELVAIANRHDLGIFLTGLRTSSMAPLTEMGFVPEMGLGAILARSTGSTAPVIPMASGTINNTAYGTMMSYLPRGFAAPMFSKAEGGASQQHTRGTPVPRVQAVVDAITAHWANAPEVVVVSDMQDEKVPQKVREADQLQKSQGAEGEPDGFIYKGTVYLVASELPTINDAVRVLMHEALGHSGLRGAFGDALKPILSQVAAMRRADIVKKAREYGLLNPATPRDASVNEQWQAMSEKNRQVAAEEVLAVMAQTQPELGFVKRAVSAIRNWLRANVPGVKSLAMTDADIIQAFILPARRHIEGKQASSTAKNTSLEAIAQRESNLLDLIACLG